MKKTIVFLVFLMFILFSFPAFSYSVKDADALNVLGSASIFGGCSAYYCSSLTPDYRLKLCGTTAYKYYCGEGNTCEDGACIPKPSDSCQAGWVGEFYCSSLTPNSRVRLYQNKDCSTTAYKYGCGTNGLCDNGACVKKTPEYEEKLLESYCSGLSNARMELWQLLDGRTEARKYNCDTDQKCADGSCQRVTCSTQKLESYCSTLTNARVELWQNRDCSTTSIKTGCGSDEVCSDAKCVTKQKVEEKLLDTYCSELSNARVELWQNADGTTTAKKWFCGVGKHCEDAKCVKGSVGTNCFDLSKKLFSKPSFQGFLDLITCPFKKLSDIVGNGLSFRSFLNFSGFMFQNIIIFFIIFGIFYYFKPSLAMILLKNPVFWYIVVGLFVLGMVVTIFGDAWQSATAWFRWFT